MKHRVLEYFKGRRKIPLFGELCIARKTIYIGFLRSVLSRPLSAITNHLGDDLACALRGTLNLHELTEVYTSFGRLCLSFSLEIHNCGRE